jgi:hypothetical protein
VKPFPCACPSCTVNTDVEFRLFNLDRNVVLDAAQLQHPTRDNLAYILKEMKQLQGQGACPSIGKAMGPLPGLCLVEPVFEEMQNLRLFKGTFETCWYGDEVCNEGFVFGVRSDYNGPLDLHVGHFSSTR